ncbi:MAG: hypothetical protein EU539_04470 [Promethearchaeota archaeon]|nr:MAG: hypothetical protein EU539_04470 [Candidatus Lokiarchaeota archaeon]
MNDFINYLKKNEIVEKLIDFYQVSGRQNVKFIHNMVEKIRKIGKNNHDMKLVDPISGLYEKNVYYKERKELGEIYTPNSIVKYILCRTGYTAKNDIANKRLIDISCGSGNFLIHAIKILINHFKSIQENSTLDWQKAISKVKHNIVGVDVNPIACILCQINIQFTLFQFYENVVQNDKDYQFPFFKILNMDALKLQLRDDFQFGEFYDFVVGNPPYLFIRNIPDCQRSLIENSDFKTSKGQYDYYQIFLELGIALLTQHGQLGYILPDSILALTNRSIVRKYIYKTTKIKEIFHTGSRFDGSIVSNVIIILQKEHSESKRENNIIQMKQSSIKNNQIMQKKIKEWDYKFLIHLNDKDSRILDYLNNQFPKLKEIMEAKDYKITLSRGVELGKDGKIIFCDKCQKYSPLPRNELICRTCSSLLSQDEIEIIVVEDIPDNQKNKWKLFLYSLNRFQINDYKYIDISKKGINYKNLEIYKDRIIIRQLPQDNLICATYDDKLSLTSQSFYNLKILKSPIKEFNHLYLLGLFNSSLLSYFFIKSFGSYKKLFPRILIEKIKNLPVKIPENEKEKEIAGNIINIIKELLDSRNSDHFKRISERLDHEIFDLYRLPREKKTYIMNYMNNI